MISARHALPPPSSQKDPTVLQCSRRNVKTAAHLALLAGHLACGVQMAPSLKRATFCVKSAMKSENESNQHAATSDLPRRLDDDFTLRLVPRTQAAWKLNFSLRHFACNLFPPAPQY